MPIYVKLDVCLELLSVFELLMIMNFCHIKHIFSLDEKCNTSSLWMFSWDLARLCEKLYVHFELLSVFELLLITSFCHIKHIFT